MELLIRQLATASSAIAGKLFLQECEIEEYVESADFCLDLVRVFVPDLGAAKQLLRKKEKLAEACRSWGQSAIQIFWSQGFHPFTIPASPRRLSINGDIMAQTIIATPTVEVGALTLTQQLLDKISWMIEHPEAKTGITRLHDEAQVVMSASSAALLTTTTLKEAVHRKRSEFWHPHDLLEFRIHTGEQVRDLMQGNLKPEDTLREVSWRCVSRSGKWRLLTVEYQTFIDEATGLAYQYSRNLGAEAIEPPTDLILI